MQRNIEHWNVVEGLAESSSYTNTQEWIKQRM